ncbi:hypothetical protein Lal_00034449 [Lupinus albus]|uniref:Putative The fantastic four family protein n=1 Tax=Lupinus albus TaxID=3870 RepID=A0A6A5PIH2_LUPAL|nr:putative The fantastic four family protein [Lupinus albus]KAF1896749.1 hypothetical protein Lal_00034449 [Lupinus albus]
MSTWRSLQHIFENPLPENPTLLESLSWNKIKPLKPIDHSSSFTEIFGELHFKESPEPSPPSSCSCPLFTKIEHGKVSDTNQTPFSAYVPSTPITNSHTKSSDSFTSLNTESLNLCTEGLGSESCDGVEDLKSEINEWWETQKEKEGGEVNNNKHSYGECRTRSRVNGGEYPPPISCIGSSGKPWVSFMSYRNNGRFILRGIKIPTQELLHAQREDGRLMLHFVEPDEEFLEEEEYDDAEHESIGEDGEEIMGKENEKCVKEFNEEK